MATHPTYHSIAKERNLPCDFSDASVGTVEVVQSVAREENAEAGVSNRPNIMNAVQRVV